MPGLASVATVNGSVGRTMSLTVALDWEPAVCVLAGVSAVAWVSAEPFRTCWWELGKVPAAGLSDNISEFCVGGAYGDL